MNHILILGAHGQIARVAINLFLQRTDAHLTLYLLNASRLKLTAPAGRVQVVEGDVLDPKVLAMAMVGQAVGYANLAGDLEAQARGVIAAMEQTGLKRLIWVSSMGIYDEVPGEHSGRILDPYRKSARLIEASTLDYTLLRPAWLNDRDEIAYGTTRKGEPFKNGSAQVSRKSVADLVVRLATTPGLDVHASLGVHPAS